MTAAPESGSSKVQAEPPSHNQIPPAEKRLAANGKTGPNTRHFLDLLATEKIPYFLVILFAIIGGATKYLADRLRQSPLIESRLTKEVTNTGDLALYRITNVSSTILFKDLQFSILLKDGKGSFLSEPNVEYHEPMALGERREPPNWTGDSYTLLIPQFHPGWSFNIVVRVSADSTPLLTLSSKENAVKLVSFGIETFLVKNELTIIVILLFFCLVVGAVFIIALLKHFRKTSASPSAESRVNSH